MKAVITHDGVLSVIPENETESYALRLWLLNYNDDPEMESLCSCPSTLEIKSYSRHEAIAFDAAQRQSEPIDEAANDRRFRECMAAIDKATPEQIRAATPDATQEDPQTLHSVAPPTTEWLPSTALLHGGSQPAPSAAPAPAGGLVERVTEAINKTTICERDGIARAAILAVAEWLYKEAELHLGGGVYWSRQLREEVQRG